MKSTAKLVLASALVVLLALAGCSSDSGSDDAAPAEDTAKTTTTAKTTDDSSPRSTTTAAGGSSGSSAPSGELGPDAKRVIATIDAIDTSDFCEGLRGVVTAFSASLSAPSGAITESERLQIDVAVGELLDEVGDAVPPAIEDDWKTASPALSASPEQQSKAEQEAIKNVSTWVSTNCAPPED